MDDITVEAIIEGILFSIGDSLELEKIATAIEHDKETTRKIIYNMMDKYEDNNRGCKIIELDGSFQLCTKPELYEYISKIIHLPKRYNLTDVLLETLSIIAYKQPVTKLDIENIRGVKCDHAVNKLIEYNLVMEIGRLDAPGRPILFGTSEEFLRHFGLTSLEGLPQMSNEKIEDFKLEVENEVQLKLNI
ncbi:MAG TPA: SMC-Scp complex subunit ScpB [Clostridiales bacterium]|nr:SMC-Scp complex subunit ScpB [Clostridiales bacterium]